MGMKILALAKHVPESTAAIKIKADRSGIETAGIKFVMNPFCEFAVEEALRIRERHTAAAAEISVLTLGGAAAADVIRTAYAMGVDNGIHLCDDAFSGVDELMTARIIAAAVRSRNFDLILAGKHAIDYDSGQLGPALAECLGWPHVGAVTSIEWAGDFKSLTARRRIEGAEEVVEVRLPCLLTCEKGLNEARYPSLPGLMKAKKKPIETLDALALGLNKSEISTDACATRTGEFSPPPPRPPGRMLTGEPADVARELVRILREEERLI